LVQTSQKLPGLFQPTSTPSGSVSAPTIQLNPKSKHDLQLKLFKTLQNSLQVSPHRLANEFLTQKPLQDHPKAFNYPFKAVLVTPNHNCLVLLPPHCIAKTPCGISFTSREIQIQTN
jgi:hypothetical protein